MHTQLKQTVTEIANYKTVNGDYPASLAVLNNGAGPQKGVNTHLAYSLVSNDFCLSVGMDQTTATYHMCGTGGQIQSGTYAGQESALAGYPTRLGYTNISNSYGTGDTILAPIGSIPTGAWMIVILTSFVSSDHTPPAGWTTLGSRHTTNTLQTSMYAKIKQSGDAASQEFQAAGTNGIAFVNAALLWGENSAAVGSWQLGAYGDRNVNASTTTAITPTISVSSARSLVLSIATERTNADETNYVSLVGATPWVWIPQPTGSLEKNQTIAVGYNEQATAGVSQAMTVTYPNAQTYNATGVQIAIPPAL